MHTVESRDVNLLEITPTRRVQDSSLPGVLVEPWSVHALNKENSPLTSDSEIRGPSATAERGFRGMHCKSRPIVP